MYKILWVLFAAAAAAQTIEQQSREILESALKDKNPDTRRQAVVALSLAVPGDLFLGMLESALADRDVEVRQAAVSSLLDLKSKRATALLHKALEDDVPEVSFAAARALWSLNDPAGEHALVSILSGETKTASGFLTRQKRDALRMMHTPKTMFLFALKQGIGFAPVPGLGEGISSMQGLLSDPGVSGRATAALLLARDRNQATLNELKAVLKDKEWSMGAAAVHSLAVRNNPALQTDIAPLIDDKKEAVRLRAAAGWLRLERVPTAPKPKPIRPKPTQK